ncbi:MAG: hypothetical protein M0R40_07895 [Firmicutes bacterium]|nr:hypothetical protein [Bacillota bacterium]
MAENLDKAIEQLKNMLATDEGKKKIEGILNNIASDAKPFDDPHINLLSALRPCVSPSKQKHLDDAINLVAICKLYRSK